MRRLLRTLLIHSILVIIVILLVYSAFILDRLFGISLPDRLTWLGWPFITAGAVIVVWAVVRLLGYGGATGAPGDPTRRLVQRGPYGRVRNPIYAADVLILMGLAFLTRSPSLLIYNSVYLLAIDRYVRRFEEPDLERRFGQEYLAYKASVPRWFLIRHQENLG